MMREDTAMTRWCPLSRVSTLSGDYPNSETAINRLIGSLADGTNCLGSTCMLWRDISEPEPERMAREAQLPLKSATRFGYCGLAGKPEDYAK
jgi:hypothetical protein